MRKFVISNLENFVSNEAGQGITEYGAILAFVAILITLVTAMHNYWWTGNHSLVFQMRIAFESVRNKLWALVGLTT
jgi:Flp pilus assembly pilin Flp